MDILFYILSALAILFIVPRIGTVLDSLGEAYNKIFK